MDLNSIIALGIFGLAFSLIGFKALSRYLKHEAMIVTSDQKANFEKKILDLSTENTSLENSRNGYKQKLNFIKNNSDIFFDDDELLQDATMTEEKIIPAIASALFPKLPTKVKELLGNEDIEKAIFGAAEKNPELISKWVGKFFSKKDETPGTQVLKEKYL